jgi:hypothetical protein
MKNRRESCLGVFAVDAAALVRAALSLLEALAVVLLALRFGALAAALHMRLLVVLHRVDVLAIEALAVSPAHPPLREALTVLGLASRFGALALDLALDLGLFAVEGEEVVDLAFGWVGAGVQKVMELRKSSL